MSVCEVLADLAALQASVVIVRGRLESGVGTWLRAYDCKDRFFVVRECMFDTMLAFGWPDQYGVQVDFERLGLSRRTRLPPHDEESGEKIRRALNAKSPGEVLEVVAEGMIMTRLPLEDLVYPKKPCDPMGFGHLGAAPAMLIVQRVISIQKTAPSKPPGDRK
jgi:hypothetical protein